MTNEERLLEIINKSNNKKKGRFSKFIVSLVILLNIIFTVAVLYIFSKTGSEPMTLIGCWFGFTTVELWSLSKITRSKIDKEDDLNG